MAHSFGGSWTEEKLSLLEQYLIQYLKIFHANPKAKYFHTWYVDAFAGTGSIATKGDEAVLMVDGKIVAPSIEGSAAVALRQDPGFNSYLFIEKSARRVKQLLKLAEPFQEHGRHVEVVTGDANEELCAWVKRTDWRTSRAVVFLDPYGMQVDWETIVALGATKAIDLWILFPISAVNRLLTREEPPPADWATALTRSFGTNTWQEEFYKAHHVSNLFEEYDALEKEASFPAISRFFLERMATAFHAVSPQAKVLCNSTGSPLFLLCFAAANERGAKPAIKIAQYLLGK